MDVDVGKAVAYDIVEEGEVKEAALDPVLGGVGEDDVQTGHQDYVASQKDEKRVVVPEFKSNTCN